MPIPATRDELTNYVRTTFEKLWSELEAAGPGIADFPCVDDWSVRDLLAVRVWWTEHVIEWIEAGKRGEHPITPAQGYRWKETPRLNADVVNESRGESFLAICNRLDRGYEHVMSLVDSLNDQELLNSGIFAWAGNYPVSRWISINTARQYTTARTFIRRAIRENRE